MNYKIDIQELDCQLCVAPRQETETIEECEDRLRSIKGKMMLRLAFLDDEASTDDKAAIMRSDSPFYDKGDAVQRASMLAEAMTQIGNVILAREKQKAAGPKLILPGE